MRLFGVVSGEDCLSGEAASSAARHRKAHLFDGGACSRFFLVSSFCPHRKKKIPESQVNIQIDQDGVHIQGIWTDGVTYDEYAFFDKESALDIAQLVAWTYIKQLEEDKKFYEDMLKKTDEAIAYAKRWAASDPDDYIWIDKVYRDKETEEVVDVEKCIWSSDEIESEGK